MTRHSRSRLHERTSQRWLIVARVASILFITAITSDVFAQARLEPGDTVELAVAGVPELRQRSTVNLDGEISLPLIGEVKVIGLPLSELRVRVRQLMSNKGFRQRTPDGRENIITIWPDEITIDIVEYRPVYLYGDVSKSGEQKHRPGMTVRQAIALAGGYDVLRFRTANPVAEAADLRGEYQVLWTELAQQQASIERLQAELDNSRGIDMDFSKMPIAAKFASEIAKLETEQLSVRRDDRQVELSHLRHSIALDTDQLSTLAVQRQRFEEGTTADMNDLETVKELQKKGVVPAQRVSEARRSLLWSSSSLLQSLSQLSQTGKEQEDLKRKLEQVDYQRRMEVLRDLETATVKKATINARLQAISEKLSHNAAARSQLASGNGSKPEIAIFRKSEEGWHRILADEDAELLPGDTVEVNLRSEYIPGLAER
jgi:polysaccharide export outer membrane protein